MILTRALIFNLVFQNPNPASEGFPETLQAPKTGRLRARRRKRYKGKKHRRTGETEEDALFLLVAIVCFWVYVYFVELLCSIIHAIRKWRNLNSFHGTTNFYVLFLLITF